MSSWFIRLILVGTVLCKAYAICPPGWKKWNQSCYALYLSCRMIWVDASQFCAGKGLGSLIVPNSQAENDFIWGMAMEEIAPATELSTGIWIGCQRESANSSFTCTDDKREITYENWGIGKLGNGECVFFRRNNGGKWRALPCYKSKFVACEMPDIPCMHCLTADANGRFDKDLP